MRRLAIIAAALAAMAAYGQQDSVTTTQLHEVSVVGVKQNADTEMAAVTTVGQSMAQRLGIATMRQASAVAPNFYIPEYGSRMTSTIYVRGLGARIDQPVVGLSVDGVPYLNKNNYDFDLFDIQRIEIFRGAQSILNGRNTMGGQVNISTLSPWSYSGLRAMAEYGRGNSAKAAAGLYGQLSPTLAGSATAYFAHTDGFYRNELNGGRLDKESSGQLRGKLSWHPSQRLAITNTAAASITRQGGYPYYSLDFGSIAYNDTCYYRRFSVSDGLVAGWSGKRVVVTSLTSAQYIDDNMTLDQDFLPIDYFTLTQKSREWALTQDLYAKGHRGIATWLGGAFAFYKSCDMSAPVTFKDDGIANLIEAHPNQMNPTYPIEWDDRTFVLGSEFLNITKGIAIYQQTTLALGAFDVQLGLRWDLEWATLIYDSHCSTSYTTYHVLPSGDRQVYRRNPLNINDHGHLSRNFNQLLPKLAAGYNLPGGGRIYASIAKAYKAGGFNSQMFSDVLQQRIMAFMGLTMKYDIDEIVGYKPEKSWNVEAGATLPLLDGKLDAQGCAFYISCTDQQLTAFPPGLTTGRIMTNAGRTRSMGAEASLAYRPWHELELKASYGYTNATFRRYNDGRQDYRGKRLPYAPSHTIFASATYRPAFTIAGAEPELNVNVRGVGNIYWNEANTEEQPLYATLGASVALDHGNWSLRLWGENITNTRYDTFYFVSVSHRFVQRAKPWTAGVTLRLNL